MRPFSKSGPSSCRAVRISGCPARSHRPPLVLQIRQVGAVARREGHDVQVAVAVYIVHGRIVGFANGKIVPEAGRRVG